MWSKEEWHHIRYRGDSPLEDVRGREKGGVIAY